MKLVGQYNDYIDLGLVNTVLTTEGQARPRDWPPLSETVHNSEYTSAYDLTAVNWWIYEKKDLNVDLDFHWTTGKVQWWVTKLYPGQFMPVHTDPHARGVACNRYWVPLQDYHPGHIFMYGDDVVTNYQAGNVFLFDQPDAIHGAANIGFLPRVVLQVTEYLAID